MIINILDAPIEYQAFDYLSETRKQGRIETGL